LLSEEKWPQYFQVVFPNHPTYPILVTGNSDVDGVIKKTDSRTNPEFYTEYSAARVIVDRAATRPAPPTPPAPTATPPKS
jgi:hypothetical protein